MTEQELTDARRACEDMSHDECRVGIMLQLIEIDRLRATNAELDALAIVEQRNAMIQRAFSEAHPPNKAAKCNCEHWQFCVECHPTAFKGGSNMTEQELTHPIDLQAYDVVELRFMVATALKEIDRLRATNAGLVADKESDRLAFIAMRGQRDELNSIDDELLDETARFRAEVERLNLKVAALQLDNDLFYKSMMELP